MASTSLRDLPEDVMAFYTRQARREGVSRNALLVRILCDHVRRPNDPGASLTLGDLRSSALRTRDLSDPEVMDAAWS